MVRAGLALNDDGSSNAQMTKTLANASASPFLSRWERRTRSASEGTGVGMGDD